MKKKSLITNTIVHSRETELEGALYVAFSWDTRGFMEVFNKLPRQFSKGNFDA